MARTPGCGPIAVFRTDAGRLTPRCYPSPSPACVFDRCSRAQNAPSRAFAKKQVLPRRRTHQKGQSLRPRSSFARKNASDGRARRCSDGFGCRAHTALPHTLATPARCREQKARDHQQLLRDPELPYSSTRDAFEHLLAYNVFQATTAGEVEDKQGGTLVDLVCVRESRAQARARSVMAHRPEHWPPLFR